MERPDLFARRNRLRILGLIILATVVYWMAVCAAAVATGLIVIFYIISEAGVPDELRGAQVVRLLLPGRHRPLDRDRQP